MQRQIVCVTPACIYVSETHLISPHFISIQSMPVTAVGVVPEKELTGAALLPFLILILILIRNTLSLPQIFFSRASLYLSTILFVSLSFIALYCLISFLVKPVLYLSLSISTHS
jgi:hypothetical protein